MVMVVKVLLKVDRINHCTSIITNLYVIIIQQGPRCKKQANGLPLPWGYGMLMAVQTFEFYGKKGKEYEKDRGDAIGTADAGRAVRLSER
jgi:hypothetical protein